VWGPSLWASIHLICLGAPEVFNGEEIYYQKFFEALPYVLPCNKCKRHLIDHMRKLPISPALNGGSRSIFAWSVELHNIVNQSLGKREWSVSEAYKKWSAFNPSSTYNSRDGDVQQSSTSKKETCTAKGHLCFYLQLFIILSLILLIGLYIRNMLQKRS
jgi:hypothetical protein